MTPYQGPEARFVILLKIITLIALACFLTMAVCQLQLVDPPAPEATTIYGGAR